VIVPIALVASRAWAGDPAAAEALYDEAKQLASQGRYAEACPKLEESENLDTGLGTQFHLADCWQHLGRTASAWALFREVASQAHAVGQNARERVARDRADALEPWVSKLLIAPHEAASALNLQVLRDGAAVGREQWDTPVPVDPGKHSIALLANHKRPWQVTVDVPPNGKTVTVDAPPLADIPDLPEPPSPPKRTVEVRPAPPVTVEHPEGVTSMMPEDEVPVLENRGNGQRAAGWFFVGAGIAGLATAGYFMGRWLDLLGEADPHCLGDICDATGVQLKDEAITRGREAAIVGGAGGAVLLTGIILTATAPGPRVVLRPIARGRVDVRIAPLVGARRAGMTLSGSW
jgi:serine/threonine-protein kinase